MLKNVPFRHVFREHNFCSFLSDSLPKIWSTNKGKNLLQEEQILSFKSRSSLRSEANNAGLLHLKLVLTIYPIKGEYMLKPLSPGLLLAMPWLILTMRYCVHWHCSGCTLWWFDLGLRFLLKPICPICRFYGRAQISI